MSYGRRWALYATKYHMGQHREHQLSGLRLGPFGVTLSFTVRDGWKATGNIGRAVLSVELHPRRDDERVREWLEFVMPPRIMKNLAQSREELDSGRGYRWSPFDDGRSVPLPTWRADDPSQPPGWHHDGRRWILNDDGGWFRDRSGFWRYNTPGDPGWHEKDDGSWEYVASGGTAA